MQIDLQMLAMIFFINLAYVTLNTLRFLLTMKGYRVIAPLVSMIEIIIYIYALGYAAGVSIGIKIEDKLALGYTMVTVILPSNTDEEKSLPKILRQEGYGVTQSYGEGLEGPRLILEILSQRKSEKKLYQTIKSVEERAFIISYEPKYISGGFWTKKISRREQKIHQKNQQ